MTTSTAHQCEPITAGTIAQWAVEALRREVELTPKPGLVDRESNGAHRDMDLPLFRRSIAAIAPWFSRFVTAGELSANEKGYVALSKVRSVGLACEQDMFRATGGVNTHKGGISRWVCCVRRRGVWRGSSRRLPAPLFARQCRP